MINECLNAADFMYFIELMDTIAFKLSDTLYRIEAQVGNVYWEKLHYDLWCMSYT